MKKRLFTIAKSREETLAKLRVLITPEIVPQTAVKAKARREAEKGSVIDPSLVRYMENKREQLRQFEQGAETLRAYEAYLDHRKAEITGSELKAP